MRNLYKPVLLLCTVLIVSSRQFTSAQDLYPVTLTERVDNASVIAEGKVVSQSCFVEPGSNNIYTSNKIEVYRLLKGSISTGEIEVITHGGVVGNRAQVYSSYLQLYTGQTGIFFCMPSTLAKNAHTRQAASYMVYSSRQGFIAYDAAKQTAADPFTTYPDISQAIASVKRLTNMDVQVRERIEIPSTRLYGTLGTTAAPAISAISPTTITAGTGDVLTITGSGFNATRGTGKVLFRNADNGGAGVVEPPPIDYISWTDTEIKVRVPSVSIQNSGAGSGTVQVMNSTDPGTATSSQTLLIPYSYTNLKNNLTNPTVIFKPSHIDHNGTRGGYTFEPEINFAANTAAREAFVRAMNTWVCATQMNWNLGDTTSIDSSVADFRNVVRFEKGSELPAGVLGLCISSYLGCSSPQIFAADIDIIFDNALAGNFIWQFGPANPNSSEVDFESIALHELGHAQQLGHVILPGAVMHYSFNKGQVARSLSADDINGGNMITALGFAPNACGVSPMTPGALVLSLLSPPDICSQNPFTYTPASGSGVAFNWTRATVAGISNPAGSGSNGVNEILENTTASPVTVNYNYSLTKTGCPSGSEVVAVVVKPVNTLLAGTAGGTQVCANYTVLSTGTSYSDASCDLIARVTPSGASPVTGAINVCSKLENSIPSHEGQPYCARHYDIEPASNPGTSTGTVTLYYTQAEFDAYNTAKGGAYRLPNAPGDAVGIANLRVTQFHGASATGLPDSYSGSTVFIDPNDANIVWNATASRWEITFDVTGFSGFFVHTGLNALPLRLLQFSGTTSGDKNLLQWTTAAEQNTDHFDIWRSIDGIHYTTVGKVKAAGSTTKNVTYHFSDDVSKELQPQYHYRLKMVDRDDRFTYSPVVTVKRNGLQFAVRALQNPFHQQLQINVTSPKTQNGVITLTDMNGRRLLQQTIGLPEGTSVMDVPGTHKLGTGAYVLTLMTDTDKQVIKVLKQ